MVDTGGNINYASNCHLSLKYHVSQSAGNKLALSLICTRENVTVELEADYAGYSVRPKMMVLTSSLLFIMALKQRSSKACNKSTSALPMVQPPLPYVALRPIVS